MTGNSALAVHALFTILTQPASYDFLLQFDIAAPAVYTFSSEVNILDQWERFSIIAAVLSIHFVVSVAIIVVFLDGSRASMLAYPFKIKPQVTLYPDKPWDIVFYW